MAHYDGFVEASENAARAERKVIIAEIKRLRGMCNLLADRLGRYTGRPMPEELARAEAAKAGDVGTRTLFERILLDEEGHKSWLELQLSLLDRLGEKAYSSKFVSGAADD